LEPSPASQSGLFPPPRPANRAELHLKPLHEVFVGAGQGGLFPPKWHGECYSSGAAGESRGTVWTELGRNLPSAARETPLEPACQGQAPTLPVGLRSRSTFDNRPRQGTRGKAPMGKDRE
jgi:hypothetical protein